MRRYFYEQCVYDQSRLVVAVSVADITPSIAARWCCCGFARSIAIEAEIRGHPAEHRRAVRQERSRPIVEALRMAAGPGQANVRHWPGLVVLLDDGRVEMDTNVVERAIHLNTLTRKMRYSPDTMAGRDTGRGDNADPDGQAERRRSADLVDRRARADRLRPNQGARDAYAAALDLGRCQPGLQSRTARGVTGSAIPLKEAIRINN